MVASELAVGAIGEFLNSGLKRAVSAPFQRIARLQKVDHASRLRHSTDPLVVNALDDYVRVLGSYHGSYTVTVEAFLADLKAGGLLEVMVENALIGRSSDHVASLFANLHAKFFGKDADANELYLSMMGAFTASLRESTHDPLLFTLARSMQDELRTRLDAIDECLIDLRPFDPTTAVDQSKLEESLLRIAKGLQLAYRNIRIETNRGPKNVDINRVYVPSKLSFRAEDTVQRYLKRLRKGSIKDERTRRFNQSIVHRAMDDDMKRFSYTEFADMFRRAVVLGDPGGGKSTLCQKFCYDLAKTFALRLQFGDKDNTAQLPRRLPIRIILRKFEQARSQDAQLGLLDFIVKDVLHYSGGSIEEVKRTLVYQLGVGGVVLAFDGLDEILDTSMRQDFCDLVTALCNSFPLCPVLVTSRFVGYDDARLTDEFDEFVLEKFDEPEIQTYVGKFMTVVGGQSKSEAIESSKRFIDQTMNAGADLRRNPLMLGLMGWLFLNNDDIPSNRPEIYKECAALMFERWDQRRGIIADDMSEFDRSQLFIYLASRIYGDPKLAAGVSKEWLQSSLKSAFFSLYENNAKAYSASNTFVKFITGRAWIMSEVGDSVFAFTHQTFLEYFFARNLEDKYDSVASLLKELKPRILKSEWNEVTHLALQIKTYRSLRKQEEALAWIASTIRSARSSAQRLALLAFAARSFEYLSPPEAKISSFFADITPLIFSQAEQGKPEFLAFFGLSAHYARERRDFVQTKVASILKDKYLHATTEALKVQLVNYISNKTTLSRQMASDGYGIHLPRDLQRRVIRELREGILDLVDTNHAAAIVAWQWYGYLSPNLDAKGRLAIVYNNSFLGSFRGIDGLSGLAIRATALTGIDSPDMLLSRQEASDLLISIGKSVQSLLPFDATTLRRRGHNSRIPLEFWKRALDNMVDSKASFGLIFSAVFTNEVARVSGGSYSANNKSDMRRWAIKWLSKPVNQGRSESAYFLKLIENDDPLAIVAKAVQSVEYATPDDE